MAQKTEPKGTLRKIGRVWCVQYYDPARGKKTCRSLKTRIKREAEKARESAMASVLALSKAQKDHNTLGAAILREEERIEREVSVRQAERAKYALETFARFAGKDCPLRRIDKTMLEAYQRERLSTRRKEPTRKEKPVPTRGPNKGKSRPTPPPMPFLTTSTVGKELAFVRRLLRENGFEVARPRPAQGRRTPVRAFTQEELVSLFAQIEGTQKALYALLLYSGARPAEIVPSNRSGHRALLKREINLENNTVLIRTGKGRKGEAKRPRLVRIPEDVCDLLVEQMKKTPGPHVFQSNSNLSRDFDLALKRAGIPKVNALGEKLMPHSFRHSFGPLLAATGLQAFALKEALGHSSVVTTQRYVDAGQSAAPVLSIPLNLKPYTQENGCNKQEDSGEEIAEVL